MLNKNTAVRGTILTLCLVAGSANAVDIPDAIPAFIGNGLMSHHTFDNLIDGFSVNPGNPVGGTFGNSEAVNFGRGGELGLNLQAEGDLNSDFVIEGPRRAIGALGFGVTTTGDDRLRSGTDNNNELPIVENAPRTISLWVLPSVDELSENEFIGPGPDFITGTDDDIIGDISTFVDIGRFFGEDLEGRGFAIELDNNDDLEVAVGLGRTNGFGEGRPVDMAQRAIDGQWTLVTVVLPDVTRPGATDKGLEGPSMFDLVIYTDGQVWDLGDTGSADDVPIRTDWNRVIVGERSGSTQRYDGSIDDLAIWNTDLSQEEIGVMFALATSSLQYNAGEFDLLRQVHNGELSSARIGDLVWTRATGLSGNGVQGFPPASTVVFDEAAGTGVTSAVASDGLLVHYSFDLGTTGDTVLMNEGLTGGQNDGVTLRQFNPEQYEFEPGIIGQALNSGADPLDKRLNQNDKAAASFAGPTPILGDEARTTSVWVKSQATEADAMMTFGTNSPAGRTKWDMVIGNNAEDGFPEVGVGAGRTDSVGAGYSGPNLHDNEWHLVTAVLPMSGGTIGDIRIFVDGEFQYSNPGLTDVINSGPFSGNLHLARDANHVGAGGGTSPGGGRYSGLMDDVAIWNVGFSDELVKGLYDVGLELEYNAADFDALRQVFEAGSGSVEIDGLEWSYATGLPNTAGLTGSDPSYTLVLDAAGGTGLTSGGSGPVCLPDITTDGANPGDADYLVPDGAVSVSDLTTFVELWVAGDLANADITTDGANPGDADYLVPDGSVSVSDLTTFVELWLAGCP